MIDYCIPLYYIVLDTVYLMECCMLHFEKTIVFFYHEGTTGNLGDLEIYDWD